MRIITVVVPVIVLLVHLGWCQEAALIPSEYVAYEGQPDFTFQSTIHVTVPDKPSFVVHVDGIQLGTDSLNQRGITTSAAVPLGDSTTHQLNITIPATGLNEDTTLEVYWVVSSGVTDTTIATFRVQGLLDPPTITDLIGYKDFYRILSWTPPVTLNITDLDPDITGYHIFHDSADTYVVTADTSVDISFMCDPVKWYISACNRVGCGENATITFPEEPINFTLTKIEFMYNNESEPMVYIELELDTFCFRSYILGTEQRALETGPIVPLVDGKTHTIVLTQAKGIVENAKYTGQIGSEGMMKPIFFLTFDVQDIDATYEEDGTITVTCTFARGSNAQGCLVKFRNMNGRDEGGIAIQRQPSLPEDTQPTSSVTLHDLPDGEYEVVALDIESDGSVTNDGEPLKRVYTFPPQTVAPSSPDTSPTTVYSPQSDSPSGIIAGVVAGLVLILMIVAAVALIVVACLMWKKKKGKSGYSIPKIDFVSSLPVILSAPCRYEVPQTRHWIQGGPPGDPVVAAEPSKVEVEFVEEGYAEGLSNGTSPTPRHLHPRSQPPVVYSELQAKSLQAELGPCPTTDSLPDTVTAPEEGINLPGMVDASRSVSEEPSFQSSVCETKPTLDSSSSPVLGMGPPVVSQALESMRSLPEINPPPLPPPRINTDEGAPPLPLRMEPSLTDSEPESPSNTANQKALKKDHEEGDPEQEPNDEKTPTQPVDASGGSVQYLTSDGKSHFEEHATKTRNLSTMYCLKTRAQQDVGREDTMELAGHEQQRSELQQRTGRNRQYDRGQDKDSCHDDDEIQELPSNYPIPSPSNGPDVSPSDHDGDEHVKAEDETRQHTCIAMEVKSVPPS